MSITLYRIEKEEIVPIEIGSENDILLVEMRDEGKLYVYRGRYSEKEDEFVSRKLYERIINKFHNSNIIALKSKIPIANDPLLAIKNYLLDHMEDDKKFERRRVLKRIFLLEGLREDLQKFKNYEKSREWRASISNLTQVRKLSVFNFWAIVAIAGILIAKTLFDILSGNLIFISDDLNRIVNPELFRLWIQNISFTILLCAAILLVVGFINFLFIAFPLRFPIKPYEFSVMHVLNSQKMQEVCETPRSESVSHVDLKSKSEILAPPVPERKAVSISSKPQISQVKMVIDPNKKSSQPMPEEYAMLKEQNEEKLEMKDEKLSIPEAPIPKDKKKKLAPPVLDKKIFSDLKINEKTHKIVIVECDRCGGPISVPVPIKMIEESEVPVVEFTYTHGDPMHCLIVQLDKNYNERRRRTTDLISEKDFR